MPSDSDLSAKSASNPSGRRASVLGLLVRNQWLMADQALVSGMNFLTTATLARMLGVHNFGVFSVFYILLQYLNTIPMAITISPMMSMGPQITSPAEHRAFLRGMAGYQFLLSLILCAATVICALPSEFHLGLWQVQRGLLFPFVLTIFCFQAQDWYRRFCYVQGDGRTVFWNDVISYMGQVTVLGVLWWLHRMGVNTAYYAIALTSLAAFLVGYLSTSLGSSWKETKAAFTATWATGRSLLMTCQLQWLGSQGIFLIIAYVAGVSAASGIRAALALMGPVIMLYQLLDNVIPVRAASAYATGGEKKLIAYLRRTFFIIGACVGPLIIFACFFAGPIMSAVFGRAYSGFSVLVIWAGLYQGMLLTIKWLSYYFRTLNKPQVMARTAGFVSAISVSACLLLTKHFGAAGGLAAVVAGQVITVSMFALFALRMHREELLSV
jgi:O-antigen/teichoic acid export membrane protein